ncbi:lipo-like protein [Vibrio aquaticus]|uniref:Lipo-like protein n=1 Tax=Vibrio aquaticus TaxID=2496559 RepID=A0A432CYY5_9VIBR|nr:YbaY family lipoprotein [Vibrio aquaticus]RTZ16501.1 lipo-like protein [Vibrio aquaticus]
MKKVIALASSLLLGTVLMGCQSETPEVAQSEIENITGTVAYRERIALPDNAVVTVTLQDVSLMDAPAKVIAKHRFETDGAQVPFEFDLAYDSAKIEARHRYSVSARIEVDGKLRFTTDTSYPVVTDENQTDNVNLRLIGVGQ